MLFKVMFGGLFSYCFISIVLFLILFFSNQVVVLDMGILDMGPTEVSVIFYVDWVSTVFSAVVCFISSMVLLFSKSYMEGEKNSNVFINLTVLFVVSMNLMVLSGSLPFLILGWDGLGLVSYCLVIFYQSETSNYAGFITIMTNRLGDIGLILSIIISLSGSTPMYYDYGLSGSSINLLFVFLLLAAMTKSAQLPFSAWLPAAMAAPTPISALVHSSTLVTAGVYLIIRFSSILEKNSPMSEGLFTISVLTMFFSGLSACFEFDLKKIIAFSTLSQLGVMMMVLSLGYADLAFFHLLVHALFKALLFLSAGAVIHSSFNNQDIRSYVNLDEKSVFLTGVMSICSLSLMGFPFMSGFYSKDLILEQLYSLNLNSVLLLMLMVSTFLTASYSFRLFYYVFMKSGFGGSLLQKETWSSSLLTPIYVMAFVVVFGGSTMSWLVFPEPQILILTSKVKMINLLLVGGALSLFIILFFQNSNYFSAPKSESFMGGMWYLPAAQGNLSSHMLSLFFYFYASSDQAWSEFSMSKSFIFNTSEVSHRTIQVFNWGMKEVLLFVLIILLFVLII